MWNSRTIFSRFSKLALCIAILMVPVQLYAKNSKSKNDKSTSKSSEESSENLKTKDDKKSSKKSELLGKGKIKKGKKSKSDTATEEAIDPSTLPTAATEEGKSQIELLGSAGFAPLPALGFGLSGALVKPSGIAFEGSFFYSSGKSDNVVYSITHIGGRLRRSMFGFGYIAAGAGLRMANGSWKDITLDQSEEFDASAKFNAITLDGAFGGQKQFGAIVVGADLIGISYPLFKFGAAKVRPESENLDTDDADQQEKKFNDATGGLNLIVFKLGFGIRF